MEQKIKLTDIHTHLDQYKPEDRKLVLTRANEAGVRWIVTSGMDLKTSANAVEIASSSKQVLASVGVHPWMAAENFPHNFKERISDLVREEVTIAIGEVGLDFVDNVFTGVTYYDNKHLRKAQKRAFRNQVKLACELNLPLIVHCRKAYSTMLDILKKEKAHSVGGVIHNFEGGEKEAYQLLDMGFLLSFGGAITYPQADDLQKTARHVPLNSILIETDSPYMPLYSQSSESNEPANVALVARKLAELREIEVPEVISSVYANFVSLLKI